MNSKTISAERNHEFERVQGICEWGWKGRFVRKGRENVIILQSQKKGEGHSDLVENKYRKISNEIFVSLR